MHYPEEVNRGTCAAIEELKYPRGGKYKLEENFSVFKISQNQCIAINFNFDINYKV